MKKLLTALLILFAIGCIAKVYAANTPPPCNQGDILTNGGSSRQGCYVVGPGLAVVTSGSSLLLTVTGSVVPSNAIIEENGPAIIEENGPYIVLE